jgi:hypothetical protein
MMAVMMINPSNVSDEVALFNVNSHMMAVMMIHPSNVSDEVVLFNVNSHMMAVMMIQHSKVSDEVVLFNEHFTVLYHHDPHHMRVYIKRHYLV